MKIFKNPIFMFILGGIIVLVKGSDYKFMFELENDNYVFVSAEPVK